jgi:uncharacterized sporulation protein YeaH/YhbH (DUF444 family)
MATFNDRKGIPTGPLDAELDRYKEKMREVIERRIFELLEKIEIIGRGRSSDGDRIVKLKIPAIKEPQFTFDSLQPSSGQSGDGDGGDSDDNNGQSNKSNNDGLAGSQKGGEEYDEFQISLEELRKMFFEKWKLPPPLPKSFGNDSIKKRKTSGLRSRGSWTDLVRRQTFYRLIKRSSHDKDCGFGEKDLVFRKWDRIEEEESYKAVQYCIRDISGSMDGIKQEMCRVLFTYVCVLRQQMYPEFDPCYIVHTTEAEEISNEIDFFRRSATGGTKMSSALRLMIETVKKKHPPEEWNIYAMYISDGENDESDNSLTFQLISEILKLSRLFVYIEFPSSGRREESSLFRMLSSLTESCKNLIIARVSDMSREGVEKALNEILGREWGGEI